MVRPRSVEEFRRVSDLGVGDAVGGQVLGAFGGDPDDRVALLHDAGRVGEGLEIELERLAVGAPPEPRGQASTSVVGNPS